jgi:hypothetical protein
MRTVNQAVAKAGQFVQSFPNRQELLWSVPQLERARKALASDRELVCCQIASFPHSTGQPGRLGHVLPRTWQVFLLWPQDSFPADTGGDRQDEVSDEMSRPF